MRWWRWVRRFRHRCGYNVHSPTDFFLITSVIYESAPYYAYKSLEKLAFTDKLPHYRTKVNKLLFRLVNYFQPRNMIEVGKGNGAAQAYMKTASRSMNFISVDDQLPLEQFTQQLSMQLECMKELDGLHIGHTPYYKETFQNALPYVNEKTCFIVADIHENDEKKHWWKEVKQDERTGITFDLYDIGLIFFDKKRYKQDYIINFL